MLQQLTTLWVQIMTEDGKSLTDIIRAFPNEKAYEIQKYLTAWEKNAKKPFPHGTKKAEVEALADEGMDAMTIANLVMEPLDSVRRYVAIYHRKQRLRKSGRRPNMEPSARTTQSGCTFTGATKMSSIWR